MMASLNLLVGYGSDDSSASDSTDIPVTLKEYNKEPGTNFFELVGDDDSSSSSKNGNENDSTSSQIHFNENLRNPFRTTEIPAAQSVFSNPYKEAEDAEKGTLEKHVKFAPKLEDVKEINGRKICWNYRKGRCRFANNCVFAHDSELLQKPNSIDPSAFIITSPELDHITKSSQLKRSSLEKQDIVPRKKPMKRQKGEMKK